MLCLCVDGTIKEVRVSDITQISFENECTKLLLKDGSQISVDDTEKNVKDLIREELKKANQEERYIRLHLYYNGCKSEYYPICIPVSSIRIVARSYHSYDISTTGKLARDLPKESMEKDTDRHQPAIITLSYSVKDSRDVLVDSITVYESADYVMSFMNTQNKHDNNTIF